LSEFLFVIANKGTEFVEFRSAFLEPPPAKSCKADMRSFRHFDFGQELGVHNDWHLPIFFSAFPRAPFRYPASGDVMLSNNFLEAGYNFSRFGG